MIPLRISLKGFMSYRDEQVLFFDGAPLWVLAGPNGSGKSAIFDALTFALYGRHRAGSQNATDLINHYSPEMAVEFDFVLDGVVYRVRRTVPKRGRPTREVIRLIPVAGHSEPHKELIAGTDSDDGFRDWVERTIGLQYKTFTSSVLLLQGQSEELLRADPRDRYRILAELIDLSPYQKLHQLADERRKEFDDQTKSLKQLLQSESPISNQDLAAAQTAVEKAKTEWQKAQIDVDRLTALLEQSKQWERWIGELEEQRSKRDKARVLLARSDEITQSLARLHELERVLPTVQSLIEQRQRLIKHSQQISTVNRSIESSTTKLGEAESRRDAAAADLERLENEINDLQSESRSLADQLVELAPLVAQLEQLEKAQADVKALQAKLNEIPTDLETQVRQAEERQAELEEVRRALPWLRQLRQARSALIKASDEAGAGNIQLQDLKRQSEEHSNSRDSLSSQLESARDEENVLSHKVTRTQASYDDARQRCARFEDVATRPSCELCGQLITPEHAEQERARLKAKVEAAEGSVNQVRGEYLVAKERRKKLEEDLAALEKRLEMLRQKLNQAEKIVDRARQAVQDAFSQAAGAFGNLPVGYRTLVAEFTPADESGWLSTTYPTESDLNALRLEVGSQESHAKHLRELREELGQWRNLTATFQAAKERVAHLETTCPMNKAKQARQEQDRLRSRHGELDTQLKQLEDIRRKAKRVLECARNEVELLHTTLGEHCTRLTELQATKSEIERSQSVLLSSLPQVWQEQAILAEGAHLVAWQEESKRLAIYRELATALGSARESLTETEKRINELTVLIEELPQDACQPSSKTQHALESAKKQRDQTDERRRKAEECQIQLQQRYDKRCYWDEEHRKADHKRHLYSILASLLGPDGLQLHLLRHAERAIVELANETLDGLSRGRMKLELRGAEGGPEAQSNKALDLVAYNYDTGPYPTAVALTSGSQRFRIAVSLALAIGRYAGQEARRIESVIIDEGFGSLDKSGRDDMIQELNELKLQLSRIILVSHQEEFTQAFTTGYAVELIDGASHVRLLERA